MGDAAEKNPNKNIERIKVEMARLKRERS